MKQEITSRHFLDENEKPSGGESTATGIVVEWQNGPLGRGEDREEPNGAFVETVVEVALDRLRFYQEGEFKCRENALAITKLEECLHWMNHRTADREAREVEGTHDQ